jgi:hypothetical protein
MIITIAIIGVVCILLGIMIFYHNANKNIIQQSEIDVPADNFFRNLMASSFVFIIGVLALLIAGVMFVYSIFKH